MEECLVNWPDQTTDYARLLLEFDRKEMRREDKGKMKQCGVQRGIKIDCSLKRCQECKSRNASSLPE